MKIINVEDLLEWKTKIRSVSFTSYNSLSARTNPLVNKSVAFTTIFSPGIVVALDRKNGKILWRKRLDTLSNESPLIEKNRLFVSTSRTAYCLDAKTGDSLWEYTPYTENGEHVYSGITLSKGKCFIGDRKGFVHCLDLKSGQILWKSLTTSKGQINTSLIAKKNKIFAVNTAGYVYSLHEKNGQISGKVHIRFSCISKPTLLGNVMYLCGGQRVASVDLNSLQIINKNVAKGSSIYQVIAQRNRLIYLDSKKRKSESEKEKSFLKVLQNKKSTEVFIDDYLISVQHLKSNTFIVTHYEGFSIYSVSQNQITHKINFPKSFLAMCPTPHIIGTELYLVTHNATVMRLRLPKELA